MLNDPAADLIMVAPLANVSVLVVFMVKFPPFSVKLPVIILLTAALAANDNVLETTLTLEGPLVAGHSKLVEEIAILEVLESTNVAPAVYAKELPPPFARIAVLDPANERLFETLIARLAGIVLALDPPIIKLV
jgi:hypothetical protein